MDEERERAVVVAAPEAAPPPFDLEEAKSALGAAIDDVRAGAGLEPLLADVELDEAAARVAVALAQQGGGPLGEAEERALLAPLFAGLSSLHLVRGVCAEATCLAQHAEIRATGTVLGVGLHAVEDPSRGGRAIYGAVLIATRK